MHTLVTFAFSSWRPSSPPYPDTFPVISLSLSSVTTLFHPLCFISLSFPFHLVWTFSFRFTFTLSLWNRHRGERGAYSSSCLHAYLSEALCVQWTGIMHNMYLSIVPTYSRPLRYNSQFINRARYSLRMTNQCRIKGGNAR